MQPLVNAHQNRQHQGQITICLEEQPLTTFSTGPSVTDAQNDITESRATIDHPRIHFQYDFAPFHIPVTYKDPTGEQRYMWGRLLLFLFPHFIFEVEILA